MIKKDYLPSLVVFQSKKEYKSNLPPPRKKGSIDLYTYVGVNDMTTRLFNFSSKTPETTHFISNISTIRWILGYQ